MKLNLNFKKVLLTMLCVVLSGMVFAQGTGKISGKVTDKKTGETLIGVTVKIDGTTKGASTDIEGKFIIPGLASGKYNLLVSYVGYATKKITEVEVGQGLSTVNVILEEGGSQKLNEVVITATAKQESVNTLYANQKKVASISDGISADQIRRSPDRNTGDALKRISGASLQDNKFVVIRGLSDRYNASMMNNVALPSTEPDKKAFSFDVIPSNLVDNIVIYKTATPDLPGDFAGGTVKVNTKDIPEQRFVDLALNVGYNSKTTFKNNFVKPTSQGKWDFLGFDDGGRKLPAAYAGYKDQNYTSLPYADKLKIAQQFPNTFDYTSNNTALPNVSLQMSTGNSKIYQSGNKFGYVAALNYGNSNREENAYRTDFDINKQKLFSYDRNSYARMRNLGGVLNFAYLFGKNKIALKNFYNNDFTNDFVERVNGANIESGNIYYKGFSNEITQNGLLNSVLEGQHSFGKRNFTLDWNATYGYSYRNQPDQRIVTLLSQNNNDFYLKLSNENSPRPNDLGRVYSKLTENIYGGSVNLTTPFKWLDESQKLKIGVLKNYRSRNFGVDALGYVDGVGSGKVINISDHSALQNIFSPAGLQQNELVLARLDLSSTDYKGTADLNAGYLMLDNKFTEKLRLVWGARVENYKQVLTAKGKGSKDYNNTDVLPSGNLTYSLTDKMNLRASYFRALNRPEFRELADYRFYDYENNFNVTGNPFLVRSTSNNVDFRYEYYPSGGEILSISAFYKKFKDPIEQTNQGNQVLSYKNAKSARDIGVEIEIRKKLNFISEDLKNFTFYMNAAYIKAKVTLSDDATVSTPLQGQSPYLLNGGLMYITDNGDMSFNLLYNRAAQRLKYRGESMGVDIYENARNVLDFQVSKKVLKNRGELKLSFSDLLAEPFSFYNKYASGGTAYNADQDRIIQESRRGFTSTLSFKYNFAFTK